VSDAVSVFDRVLGRRRLTRALAAGYPDFLRVIE